MQCLWSMQLIKTHPTEIHVATKDGLEDLAIALAEGEHALGEDATAAGGALTMWPGTDCPWFVPGPCADGIAVADFAIVEDSSLVARRVA